MSRHVETKTVAARVRQLRQQRGLTQQQLADACDGPPSLNRVTIAKIENGFRARIPDDELLVLANALGTTVERLTEPHSLTLLHVSDLLFGADAPFGAHVDTAARGLAEILDAAPDVVLATGDLTLAGRPSQFDQVKTFLKTVADTYRLGFDRVAVIPGNHDVNMSSLNAYLANCEALEETPAPPYFPKWRQFRDLFVAWPDDDGGGSVRPEVEHPWSLYEVRSLNLVIAGLNSTIDDGPEPERYGAIGAQQAAWFAERLDKYRQRGWFRLGLVHHHPLDRAGAAEENLRDTGVLDQMLGDRLNLLLHGHGHEAAQLASGLKVLGAGTAIGTARRSPEDANLAQLIRITAGGLVRTRYRFDRAARRWSAVDSEELAEQWDAADAAFPHSGSEPGPTPMLTTSVLPGSQWERVGEPHGAEPASAPSHGPDERRRLLDDIADVCAARYERSVVHREDGRPPYLRVTYADGPATRQIRIGATVNDLRRDDIDAFVSRVHAADPAHDAELVYQGAAPPRDLKEYAMRRRVRLRSFAEFQGLLDLDDYVAQQTERLSTDPVYLPSLYVPQRYTDRSIASSFDAAEPVERDDVVNEMLRILDTDDGRFILLLGDFGRGKTFALRELARQIPERLHLVPIFLELRALDKAHSIEGMVAAHLATHHQDEIDLRAFRYMLEHGRIVLIFDGFDELVARATYERAADHLQTIIAAVRQQTKIVVASRTQYFQTHAQVVAAVGSGGMLPQRRILSVSDLSPAQIRRLLTQRYGDEPTADARVALLGEVGNLLDLASNPRMLGFIADLDEQRLRAVSSSRSAISAARLYEEILGGWLAHEEQRTQAILGVPRGMRIDDLWAAVTHLALRMWESDAGVVSLEELGSVAETLTDLAEGHLSGEQITHAVGAGSLLYRTDDGLFGFIHASVAEWLVAKRISAALTANDERLRGVLLESKPLSQLTIDFVRDLADVQRCREWIARVRSHPGLSDAARLNASRLNARLGAAPDADMHDALLANEDLSYRIWRGVDLTGADLTGARLTHIDLSGARLRGVSLVNALLDDADLSGADLTGADLTDARLVRTKLTGAHLDGASFTRARLVSADLGGAHVGDSTWQLAALVNVGLAGDVGAELRIRGAAVLPGQTVDVATWPTQLGVQFGFEEGRLPRPLAYSADSTLLAIGCEDGTVLVCDRHSGNPIRTLFGHGRRAHAVVFSPEGPMLATGSLDGTVRLWDATTGVCRHTLDGHPGYVWPLVFSPDGRLLATGARDDTVRIWDTGTGALLNRLPGHRAPVWTATFQPGGSLIATGDEAATARMWDLADGGMRGRLDNESSITYWLRFNREGTALAGAGKDGVVRVYDPDTGRVVNRFVGHEGAVYAFDFDPVRPYIVSADTKGAVRRWRLTPPTVGEGEELTPHAGAVYRITFSPKGSMFATGDSEGQVRLWDAGTGEIRHQLTGHHASVWPMMFTSDGDRLATSSNDFTTKIWDTSTGNLVTSLRGHGRAVWTVTFNENGSMMATCANDGVVRLWDPYTGICLRELKRPFDRLVSVVFSPSAPQVATASNDGRVYLWYAETGEEGRYLEVATDDVWGLAFSEDGERIAVANDDNTVQLLFRATGRTSVTFGPHPGRVRALAFSPDGRRLATVGDNPVIRVWDSGIGASESVTRPVTEPVAEFDHHSDRVYAMAFRRDGKELTTASNDGTVCFWDPFTGSLRQVVEPGRGRLWSVDYSPGGDLLATSGDDGVIDLWRVADGERVCELPGHTGRVASVSFSPDGRLLASASYDGTTRLWELGGDSPRHRMTLLGFSKGWAAVMTDGRYKADGEVQGQFWHVAGMTRFEPGELDAYLDRPHRVPLDQRLL